MADSVEKVHPAKTPVQDIDVSNSAACDIQARVVVDMRMDSAIAHKESDRVSNEYLACLYRSLHLAGCIPRTGQPAGNWQRAQPRPYGRFRVRAGLGRGDPVPRDDGLPGIDFAHANVGSRVLDRQGDRSGLSALAGHQGFACPQSDQLHANS